MGSQVSPTDNALLRQLRDAGVMEEMCAGDMHLESGMIVVSCADGDQMEDEFEHLRALFHRASANARIHLLALNGGALLISPDWPDSSAAGDVFIKHIVQAEELKRIKTVALFTHIPCGAAGMVRWGVARVIDQLIAAKLRIKEQIPETKVICLLHVDWSKCNGGDDPRKRTYHIKKEKWLADRHQYL